VAADADQAALEAKRDELQQALDQINNRGEGWVKGLPGRDRKG
jgi:hypothetical protein